MDIISIRDLAFFAYHGAMEEEQRLGQRFYLDIDLGVEVQEAGLSDDLEQTVHYGHLAMDIEATFTKQTFKLIESAAESICSMVLNKYSAVKKVKVSIKKPSAPIPLNLGYPAITIEREWQKAYIALGSNLGNKSENLENAVQLISTLPGVEVLKKSSWIETVPVGYLVQDNFMNGVILVKTWLKPTVLMKRLLEIELILKRERLIKWGPRTIDLDLILYGDLVYEDELVTIPHPRMLERGFVMAPLSEIAPYQIHPIAKKYIVELVPKM